MRKLVFLTACACMSASFCWAEGEAIHGTPRKTIANKEHSLGPWVASDSGGFFSVGSALQPKIVVSRFDTAGKKQWSQPIGEGPEQHATAIAATKNGGVAVIVEKNTDATVALTRLGPDGAVLSRTLLPGKRYGEELLETPDGSFVIAGTKVLEDGSVRAVLTKVEKSGKTSWESETSEDSFGRKVRANKSGSFVLEAQVRKSERRFLQIISATGITQGEVWYDGIDK